MSHKIHLNVLSIHTVHDHINIGKFFVESLCDWTETYLVGLMMNPNPLTFLNHICLRITCLADYNKKA